MTVARIKDAWAVSMYHPVRGSVTHYVLAPTALQAARAVPDVGQTGDVRLVRSDPPHAAIELQVGRHGWVRMYVSPLIAIVAPAEGTI